MPAPLQAVKTLPDWDNLTRAIDLTWQAIAPDACDFVESNEDALEMTVDADRLLLTGNNPAANEFFDKLCKAYGYRTVFDVLKNDITLY